MFELGGSQDRLILSAATRVPPYSRHVFPHLIQSSIIHSVSLSPSFLHVHITCRVPILIYIFMNPLPTVQVPPPHPPTSTPPNPSLLPGPLRNTKDQRKPNEPHTRTPTPDPTIAPIPLPPRIQRIPHTRPHKLPTKNKDHVRRIDSVPSFRFNSVDGCAVRDLRGLQTEIDTEGLDDGTCDGEGAGVGAYDDAGETDQFADDDGVESGDFVDDETRVGRSETHCEDPYERE